MSGQKNCPDKKIVRTKKLSGQKNCLDRKLFGQKKFRTKKLSGQKKILDQKVVRNFVFVQVVNALGFFGLYIFFVHLALNLLS